MELPAGLAVRPVDHDDPDDLEAAFAVVHRGELESLNWTDTTLESVSAELTGPLAWRAIHRLVFRGDEPVGLLTGELETPGREVFIDAYAVGEDRGEVLRTLASWGLEQAKAVAYADPIADPGSDVDPLQPSADFWQAFAGSYTKEKAYIDVLEGLGFRPVRRFWRMVCDLDTVTDVAPPAPAGVTKRSVATADDERVLHRLYHETFAEHFGSTHVEAFEDWIERVRANPGNDPARWWIAELDGTPVGLCIVDDSKAQFGEGYVRTLGVLPEARGRGIARWLLECSAADSVSRGRSAIALAVDGANTTGATALYESVGYRIRQEIDVFCYPLLGEASSSESASSRKASPQT
jgi:ribosomal protein S18 acetylase RimI-like enzyme